MHLDGLKVSAIIAAAIISFLVITPLAWLMFGSFWSKSPGIAGELTAANYVNAYSDPLSYVALFNSLIYAVGATTVAFALGVPLAWAIVRTNTPFRRFFEVAVILPYMIPGILYAVAWVFLLSPKTGLVNIFLMRTLGLGGAPFDIFTMPAMIWVDGLTGVPLVFLLLSAVLRNQDVTLEEAALIAGSNKFELLRRITLPIIRPAILAALMLSLTRYLELFEVPAIIGLPSGIYVTTTLIYRKIESVPPNYGGGTALAVTLLAISITLVYLYRLLTRRAERFTTIVGKSKKASTLDIGRWRYAAFAYCLTIFIVAGILPLLMLTLGSVLPYWGILSFESLPEALSKASFKHFDLAFSLTIVRRGLVNSFFLAVVGATVAMILVSFVGYITTRATFRGRGVLEALSFTPFSVPGLVMGVGILWAYVTLPIGIIGTVWVLMLAYITRFMPYGLRAVTTNIVQIHRELEEASRVAGASWLKTFRHIMTPMLRPGIVAGWIFLSIIFLREVSTSILLYQSGSEVLAVAAYSLFNDNKWEAVSALGVVMTGITLLLNVVARKLAGSTAVAV
ncbi:MAG: iron ABC transporter permease [Thaumarchaeota archaeon]|nr:iron ABC transporter permease [Nitrososphaerota archaeon]